MAELVVELAKVRKHNNGKPSNHTAQNNNDAGDFNEDDEWMDVEDEENWRQLVTVVPKSIFLTYPHHSGYPVMLYLFYIFIKFRIFWILEFYIFGSFVRVKAQNTFILCIDKILSN